MNFRHLPNLITVARIILVVPIVWALLTRQFTLALILFAIAGASDGIDGILARHFGWTSWLGSILDPLADKLLQISSYVALGILGIIPIWLVAAVVTRDVIIIAGSVSYYLAYKSFEAAPSLLSKLNTVLQIVYVLLVVINISVFSIATGFITVLGYVMLFTTVTSGVHYVVRWYRLVKQHRTAAN